MQFVLYDMIIFCLGYLSWLRKTFHFSKLVANVGGYDAYFRKWNRIDVTQMGDEGGIRCDQG